MKKLYNQTEESPVHRWRTRRKDDKNEKTSDYSTSTLSYTARGDCACSSLVWSDQRPVQGATSVLDLFYLKSDTSMSPGQLRGVAGHWFLIKCLFLVCTSIIWCYLSHTYMIVVPTSLPPQKQVHWLSTYNGACIEMLLCATVSHGCGYS